MEPKIIVSCLIILLFQSLALAIDTEKLKMSISISDVNGNGNSSTTCAWAGDGTWSVKNQQEKISFQVQSRYSQTDSGKKYDQVKTWLRYTWNETSSKKWQPVIVLSTSGDHDFGEVFTLGAFGYKKNYGEGNIEITTGISKDLRTADKWTGDIGILFDYSTRHGKFSAGVKPQSNYDVLGDVRFRDGRFRYTIDTDLNYDIGDNLCATYKISWSNTTTGTDKIQFIGITYEQKK
jgi:hypothetical protein